jgi:hypothetical protein
MKLASRTKLLLLGSLMINALLAASLSVRPRSPAATVAHEPVSAVIGDSKVSIRATNVATTNFIRQRFDWRALQTNDYRSYIRNLKSVGCPEKTIQEIIIGEIETAFRERRLSILASRPFWLTGSQRAKLDKRNAKLLQALEEEKRSLVKDLLALDWDQNAYDLWVSQPLQEFRLGFLPYPKRMMILNKISRLVHLGEDLRRASSGVLLPGDRTDLQSFCADIINSLAPSEWEELRLRMLDDNQYGSNRLMGAEISGAEHRQILALRTKGLDPLQRMLPEFDHTTWNRQQQAAEEESEPTLRRTLGDDRYLAYVRAENFYFQKACELTQSAQMPVEAAIKVYEIRQETFERRQQLDADSSLAAEDRHTALQLLGTNAKAAILTVLGQDLSQRYLQQDSWLQQLGTATGK